ncbi:hypothetical protein SAMN05421544_10151 [Riemerella columbipharyngis]|uniref:Uncharacterized protein n=1 Tax=Riemerella columbipharyngis TaxID=1071918 RepID=A0A1G6Y8J5_9FLAO|nr:hypothetical protein SAMN05421544_10151 [Riemerella columbipharyngis]
MPCMLQDSVKGKQPLSFCSFDEQFFSVFSDTFLLTLSSILPSFAAADPTTNNVAIKKDFFHNIKFKNLYLTNIMVFFYITNNKNFFLFNMQVNIVQKNFYIFVNY